jgi:hypothetical protein
LRTNQKLHTHIEPSLSKLYGHVQLRAKISAHFVVQGRVVAYLKEQQRKDSLRCCSCRKQKARKKLNFSNTKLRYNYLTLIVKKLAKLLI